MKTTNSYLLLLFHAIATCSFSQAALELPSSPQVHTTIDDFYFQKNGERFNPSEGVALNDKNVNIFHRDDSTLRVQIECTLVQGGLGIGQYIGYNKIDLEAIGVKRSGSTVVVEVKSYDRIDPKTEVLQSATISKPLFVQIPVN